MTAFLPQAARWATTLSYDDIPDPVCEAALAQRASTLGAGVWTTTHPIGATIRETTIAQYGESPATTTQYGDEPATTAQYGEGQATALWDGGSDRLSPVGAAYGNAALSMALDFDDTVLGGHTGHSTVFVPLAYGEALDAPQECVVCAQVAANEVTARIASAAAVGPFRGQQTAYVHATGAAVGRAVVAGDDATTLENALGIALGQPPWPLEAPFFGSDAKVWTASEPLRTGLSAIDAARSGQRGHADTVTGESGFLDSFATVSLPAFLSGLGERWHTRAVTVKAVPGCAYVTAPVEAALRIADRVDVGRIDSVTVRGSLFATEVDQRASRSLSGPDSPLSALTFTVPYNVAAALVDGEHTPRQLAPDRVADRALWDLARRTEVLHDERYTMAALESEVPLGAMLRRVGLPVIPYAARAVGVRTTLANLPTLARFVRKRPLPDDLSDADKRMGARVEVTAGTTTYVAEVDHPSGFAGHPLSDITAVATGKLRDGLVAAGVEPTVADRAVDDWMEVSVGETLPPLLPDTGDSVGERR